MSAFFFARLFVDVLVLAVCFAEESHKKKLARGQRTAQRMLEKAPTKVEHWAPYELQMLAKTATIRQQQTKQTMDGRGQVLIWAQEQRGFNASQQD